jgi:hyperosmotically inducible periplasmic protein
MKQPSSHCATLVAAAIAVLALGACGKSGAPSASPPDQSKQAAEQLAAKINRASADAAIVFAVNLGLARDGRLNLASIDVEAYRGRVGLRGTAPDADSVARARQIVLGVEGVTGIDIHLTVHPRS